MLIDLTAESDTSIFLPKDGATEANTGAPGLTIPGKPSDQTGQATSPAKVLSGHNTRLKYTAC